jgi:hypothetical protein
MTPRRRRMRAARPLRGLAPRTQPCSVAAVRQLARDSRGPPDQLSDEDRRQSVLDWRHQQQGAESTCRLHLEGIRGVYARTRTRPWPVFDGVRPRHPPTLPVVLRPQAVRARLAWGKPPPAPRGLRLRSAGGLRLTAGTQLQGAARDAPRLRVQVRCGPGGTARGVPLAPRGLTW